MISSCSLQHRSGLFLVAIHTHDDKWRPAFYAERGSDAYQRLAAGFQQDRHALWEVNYLRAFHRSSLTSMILEAQFQWLQGVA